MLQANIYPDLIIRNQRLVSIFPAYHTIPPIIHGSLGPLQGPSIPMYVDLSCVIHSLTHLSARSLFLSLYHRCPLQVLTGSCATTNPSIIFFGDSSHATTKLVSFPRPILYSHIPS